MSDRLVRVAAAVVCLAAASCQAAPSARITHLRIAAGPREGTFFILADALATVYTSHVPGVVAEVVETGATTRTSTRSKSARRSAASPRQIFSTMRVPAEP
jgi:TRAP-type uncharacterized transport system substrate-binding protein